MSASQEKKKRRDQAASGQGSQRKKRRTGAWIGGIGGALVVVLLVAFFAMLGTGFFETHATAVTVGSHKLSPAMFNYFYRVVDQNGLLSQMSSDAESYAAMKDYYLEQTNSLIAQTYAVYDDAVSAGFTLSDEQRAAVDAELESLQAYAAANGDTAAAFLTKQFGKGSNLENYREYVELTQTVSAYTSAHADDLSYTDAEIRTYYEENRDSIAAVSYRSFLSAVESGETDESGAAVIDEAASEQQARAMAEAARGDEAKFAELAYEYAPEDDKPGYEDPDATLASGQTLDRVPAELKEWLSDPARKSGDTAAVSAGESGWYAVLYVDGQDNEDLSVVDVRHILIRPESSDEAAKSEAKAKAEALLTQFQSGDQTEDSFAELAKANSADGNAVDGGLYEDVYPGQMVASFNDWCFDPARLPGDTGIVETSYGYHVMYFVGTAGSYVEYRMRNDDTNAWSQSLGEALPVTSSGFGMRFTKLK